MGIINFAIDSSIVYKNHSYIIKGFPSFGEVLIKDTVSPYKEKIVKVYELSKESTNTTNPLTHLVELDEKSYETAIKKFNIINPLLNLKSRTMEDIKVIAKKHKVGVATLYRWLEKYENSGTISSLASAYKNSGGKGKARLSEETENVMESVINSLYLNQQQYPLEMIYRNIVENCRSINTEIPSKNTVRNRINTLNPKLVAKYRKNVSIRDTRGTPGKFPEVKMPLDVIQIDHTKVDIMLVDETTRENIGRPNITVAIDVFSRMIYGFYISLEPVGFFSAGQCLLNAILPKDDMLKRLNVQGEWSLFGLPRKVHMDNAKEFRSNALQKFCQEYRIEHLFRPVARPEFGGAVERVIGTHMQNIHQLPGSTFSNVRERGTYDSEKYATMTITELEQWYLDFVINIYHKTEHSSLGMSPEEKFYQGLYGIGDGRIPFLPSIPADTLKLRMSLLPAMERCVQKNGITIDYVTYFSETLRKWIIPANYKKLNKNLLSKTLVCKRDPRDISKLYVYDPDIEDYIIVPYSDIRKPAINQTELRHAIAKAKKEVTGREIEMHDVFAAHERLNEYVEKAKREKRSTLRHNSSKNHIAKVIEYEKKTLENHSKITEKKSVKNDSLTVEEDLFEYYEVDE
ncbi:DDE-type integrase/transposase/recombinase [Sulfurimonas sp. RIFOXYB12_FULL_35_9]|uniref:DDE-type integrase/transposase/recombinase n=1 Tax=Sulfurimonas sp. RIFOXYB12_FULL_35_9 TaxID=1802256 RepID=UPI0008C7AE5D|nr:DDE-type integrase/transposase/recombinase [Sulfurimonas sp. RIFOXYB12_FULL_35_9]OHE05421.1 MAG: hypothetical protein A2345_01445 [Sulfurimonas sp. RIFOXYB12_FULL_35_9]